MISTTIEEIVSEKVTFLNRRGQKLAARLEKPTRPPHAFAIFAHCFTCSKDVVAASRISRALAQTGFGVLRFDFTGLGNSEGDFANTDFSSNLEDLLSAASFLDQKHSAPVLLIGHSLGGAAVLAVAHQLNSVRAVITIGAPSDPAHVTHLFEKDLETIQSDGAIEVELAGRKFMISREFVDDLARHPLAERVREMRKALLIFHSPMDSIVSIHHAQKIYEAAHHPKSFISLDGADHLLTKRGDSEYVASMIAAWGARYISPIAVKVPINEPRPESGEVLVQGEGHAFLQRVLTASHEFFSDEPTESGGSDRGPTPYDLLLAALGSCTSMTLAMYSRRKGWPLKSVKVRLGHTHNHVQDCESSELSGAYMERIERKIELTGELSDEQKNRLKEIAEKCPIHKTLLAKKTIVTSII